ncbi:MAG TPA: hypothetical protein VMY42_25660, partial [Thermoguttaceae bacterium]|nr:hypothetical protein [Thermoguttaceae bacterium]
SGKSTGPPATDSFRNGGFDFSLCSHGALLCRGDTWAKVLICRRNMSHQILHNPEEMIPNAEEREKSYCFPRSAAYNQVVGIVTALPTKSSDD